MQVRIRVHEIGGDGVERPTPKQVIIPFEALPQFIRAFVDAEGSL